MLKVEVVRGAHGLDRLKARWEWLEKQGDHTLFQSYELNRRAAEWFAARETPHVVVAESNSGMAIIPAVRRERELAFLGEALFDYRDVLSAGEPYALEHAWRELAKSGVPLEVTALRGEAARERWQSLEPKGFCNAPATRACDITAGEFGAAHHKAAKASRHLRRSGLELVRHDRELGRVAEWVYRRKAEWRGTSENLFWDQQRQNFMLSIVSDGLCGCEVWCYESEDGEIAAALVSFRQGRTRHFYTIHHDRRWERLSPGQVMLFDVVKRSLEEGLEVDFMTGEYPYKNRLATAMVPLFRVAATASQMASWRSGAQGMLSPAA